MGAVTKTPGELGQEAPPEYEVLEELGDDAIIAQQSVVHCPQPRAQVAIESRSIVIAEQPEDAEPTPSSESEPTRQLPPYAVSSMDPTVVIRDRKFINSLNARTKAAPKGSSAVKIAIWGGAGVIAFGIGGLFALVTAGNSEQPLVPAWVPDPTAAIDSNRSVPTDAAASAIHPDGFENTISEATRLEHSAQDAASATSPKASVAPTDLPLEPAGVPRPRPEPR